MKLDELQVNMTFSSPEEVKKYADEKDEIRYSELQDINDNIGEYREYQINKLIAD